MLSASSANGAVCYRQETVIEAVRLLESDFGDLSESLSGRDILMPSTTTPDAILIGEDVVAA
jgi:hypothetical protein